MHVLCFSPLLTTTMYHVCDFYEYSLSSLHWLVKRNIWYMIFLWYFYCWLITILHICINILHWWLIDWIDIWATHTIQSLPKSNHHFIFLPQISLIWNDSFCPTQTCSALFIFFFLNQIFVNQGVTSGKTKTWLGVSLIKHFTLLSKRTTSNWWNFFTHSKIYCWDIFNFCIWRLLYHSWTQRILSIMQ